MNSRSLMLIVIVAVGLVSVLAWNHLRGTKESRSSMLPLLETRYSEDGLRVERELAMNGQCEIRVREKQFSDEHGLVAGGEYSIHLAYLDLEQSAWTLENDTKLHEGTYLHDDEFPFFVKPGAPAIVVSGYIDAGHPGFSEVYAHSKTARCQSTRCETTVEHRDVSLRLRQNVTNTDFLAELTKVAGACRN